LCPRQGSPGSPQCHQRLASSLLDPHHDPAHGARASLHHPGIPSGPILVNTALLHVESRRLVLHRLDSRRLPGSTAYPS
jgi:hypothetical protein